jgi:hypothetical protein
MDVYEVDAFPLGLVEMQWLLQSTLHILYVLFSWINIDTRRFEIDVIIQE